MGLSLDQSEWLSALFEDCSTFESRLTPWETNFIDDQIGAYHQYGEHMQVSVNQMKVLRRIREKLDK